MGAEWQGRRGAIFGCGMGTIPLGEGVVGVDAIARALADIGFDGDTTLEVAGPENVIVSLTRIQNWLTPAPIADNPQ